jgi:ketosteroid isomerase-like protein
VPAGSAASVPDTTALYATIAARDSALFDAFNRCDTTAIGAFFTDDLEFYHDWNGAIGPRTRFLEGFTDACRKHELGRRELLSGTMEVHPMRNVGAVQIGVHRFFIRTPGGGETPGSTAKFVMLWRNSDGVWRISRVLSFDHRRPDAGSPAGKQ